MDSEHALFSGKISGLITTLYENELPPQGLSGMIDWRFEGIVSSFLRKGAITGRVGECIFMPLQKNGRIYPTILVGCGRTTAPGVRPQVSIEILERLRKNIVGLKLDPIGISNSDFGGLTPDLVKRHLRDVKLWVTQ